MASFLVTKNMPGALRARVEAALEADLRQRTLFPKRSRTRQYLRVLLAALAACLLVYLIVTYRQSRREVEAVRAQILAEHRKLYERSATSARSRLRTLAEQIGMLHAANAQAPNLGTAAELERLLERRLLYVRGDVQKVSTPGRSVDTARESSLDALVTCLVTPPANLRESTLLRAGGKTPPEARVFAFATATSALDFFESTFEGQVRTAQHMQELQNLRTRLERPELRHGALALGAEILLIAIDEPKAAGVVSDFDGEAPHDIVLFLVEVDSGRVVWRRRAHVDPTWISEKSRLSYSRGLDSCRLAYELLRPVGGARDP